jgi:glutathione S-transferase
VKKIILYTARNACSLASHIALEYVGADYEVRVLDFSANQQRTPDYLGINPKGRVPALITEQGILTETPAILAFICQTWPQANLAPVNDPFRFAKLQEFNSYLCSTVHVAHAHLYRGYRWADDPAAIEDMKKKVPQTVGECFTLIEQELLKGPWVFGDTYTVSDMYLYTVSQWLEADGVDIQRFPKVAALRQRMSADPVVTKVLARVAAG